MEELFSSNKHGWDMYEEKKRRGCKELLTEP